MLSGCLGRSGMNTRVVSRHQGLFFLRGFRWQIWKRLLPRGSIVSNVHEGRVGKFDFSLIQISPFSLIYRAAIDKGSFSRWPACCAWLSGRLENQILASSKNLTPQEYVGCIRGILGRFLPSIPMALSNIYFNWGMPSFRLIIYGELADDPGVFFGCTASRSFLFGTSACFILLNT